MLVQNTSWKCPRCCPEHLNILSRIQCLVWGFFSLLRKSIHTENVILLKCKWENEVQTWLCCFHLKFIITLISQVSSWSVNLFETFMVPFSLMASYDTLHVYLFRAGISSALAEEVEIRNTLWSLNCVYIYFILVLSSFGKVNAGVFSYIIYLCIQYVYWPFQLTV